MECTAGIETLVGTLNSSDPFVLGGLHENTWGEECEETTEGPPRCGTGNPKATVYVDGGGGWVMSRRALWDWILKDGRDLVGCDTSRVRPADGLDDSGAEDVVISRCMANSSGPLSLRFIQVSIGLREGNNWGSS